jgi:hypothetical protein
MLRTNEEDLVMISVMGEICHPVKGQRPYLISHDGTVMVVPGIGGITYNKRIGDNCVRLAGDHVEPGVSTKNTEKADSYAPGYNRAYNALACIGNEAVVVKSEGAKGEKGIVTGKHGGIEHVIIDFPPNALEKLVIGDKLQIRAFGQGLKLLDHPNVGVRNLDPAILHKMAIEQRNGILRIGVAKMVPGKIMGSGLGADQTWTGDYDIQLFDQKTVDEFGLADLRFGDFVAIIDADHTYGRIYKQGAISIGIIVHSACFISGHGPGVTTLLTAGESDAMGVYVDPHANLAHILGIT